MTVLTLEPMTGPAHDWTPVTHPADPLPVVPQFGPLEASRAFHQRTYDAARELCGLAPRPLRRKNRDRAAREGVAS